MKPLSQPLSILRAFAALALAGLLAGCAAPYLMDHQVQSFSTLPGGIPVPATFRFERLPSQATDAGQAQVEAAAAAALTRAGLQRSDPAGRYVVQAWSRQQQSVSPWARSRWSGWGSWGVWGGHRGGGVGVGMGLPLWDATPWYQREVGLLVRDTTTGQVVYETHAVNDGPWIAPEVALPAMFDAALQGFPNPPSGPRRVDIRVMR